MPNLTNFALFRPFLLISIGFFSFFPKNAFSQILAQFPCNGGPQTYVVPAGICQIKIKAWGGGSGGGGIDAYPGGVGSGGTYAEQSIGVSAGDVLTIYTGCRGFGGIGCGANYQGGIGGYGYGNGGTGGAAGPVPCSGSGGGGGGSSAVQVNGSLVIVAAGGGGGGGAGCTSPGGIGGAGGTNGGSSTCTSGGLAASNSTYNGAVGSTHMADGGGGGGGGGGAFNGGQGGFAPPSGNSCNPSNDCGAGGGAGGNSYAPTGIITNGSGQIPGNSGDPDLCGGCSTGGGSQGAGTDGYVVLYKVSSTMTASETHLDVLCNGGNTGSAQVSVTGGTSPYSYTWSNNCTTQQANGLSVGNYYVTVTDVNKCKILDTIQITEPTPIALSISNTQVSCHGLLDADASVMATGGKPNYTYSWNTIPVQTATKATQLAAGNYTVTVTDANACVKNISVSITEPPALSVQANKNDVSCYQGADGSATISVSGGTPIYQYVWNTTPVQTTQNLNNLQTGTFDVTVTDSHACKAQVQIQINEPSPLQASISAFQSLACNGGKNGTASVLANGGTAPYTYSWNSVPPKTSANATGFSAGSYTVTVTDSKLCKTTAQVTLTEPPALFSSISASSISCNAGSDGTATVLVGGGVPPYSYSWNTSPIQTTSTAISLQGITYIVTVTDSNLCKTVNAILVPEPSKISISSLSTPVSCKGKNDGSIIANPSGGTPPYSYVWNIGNQTSSQIKGLAPGAYSVTVTDSKGCKNSNTFNITEPALLSVTHSQTNVSCFGGNDGTATALASGGSIPYTYSWSSIPVQTGIKSTSLSANTYTLQLTDLNHCMAYDTIQITEPPPLLSNISGNKPVSCKNGNDGAASVLASGGSLPYTYLWSSSPAQNTANANQLVAGNYSVSITDAHGCKSISNVSITEPTLFTLNISSLIPVSCYGGNNGSAASIGSGGIPPYTYAWNTIPIQTGKQATGLKAGTYQVLAMDSNHCIAQTIAVVMEPNLLSTQISQLKNVSCFGGHDGMIAIQNTGGTAPYAYVWNTNPQQILSQISGLLAGNYTLTVTDKSGCKDSIGVQISEPPLLQASIPSSTDVSCFSAGNGSATVTATGGTAPYTYLWNTNPVQTDVTAHSLLPGSYTVIIQDSLSCTTQSSVLISGPSPLSVILTQTAAVSCHGGKDGTAVVSASGGIPGYSYLWDTQPNQIDSAAVQLMAGTYHVTVTDSKNCQANMLVNITEPSLLVANIQSKKDVSCYGSQDGKISLSQSGGIGPYKYLWSNGESISSIQGLKAGVYGVTITDSKACIDTLWIQIYEPAKLHTLISGTKDVSCKSGNDGEIYGAATGGTPTYQYHWNTSPIQNTDTAKSLIAGIYTLILTDQNGCTDSSTISITEPDSVEVIAIGVDTLCIGQSVNIIASAHGGNPAYTYLWNNGQTGSAIQVHPVLTNTYSVVAIDNHMCISEPYSVDIHVRPPLDVQTTPVNPICRKESVLLQAQAKGGDGNYFYQWKPSLGGSSANIVVNPNVTTTYTVTVTDGCGTPSDSDSVVVKILPLPSIQFSGDTLKGCSPHEVSFTDLSQIPLPSGLSSWYWNFGDYKSSDNVSVSVNPEHTYQEPGIYDVNLIVTSTDGCIDTLKKHAYISVYQPPISMFYSDRDTVKILKSEFNFFEQAKNEISYQWDFGDGIFSAEKDPKHSYAEAGTYKVCLKVSSAFHCIDIFCKTVVVEGDFTFYVPNAFTPDNDGINDDFGGNGIGIKTYELHIFDRWGNMIFLSDQIEKRWDGHANGGVDLAQMDVYLYLIKIKDIFDKEHTFVGHVTLVK